jgi:hypothetical protein
MSATSWSRFYWNDWRSDPKLRACSIAARGLWIELLAIMAEAEPRGYLLVNGQKPDTKLIRTLAGIERNHVGKLLQELEQAGVFSRTEGGVIFSRRMVRDEEKIAERRRCGALGGNPDLKVKEKLQDKARDNLDLKSARARPSPSPSPEERKEEEVGAQKEAPRSGNYAFQGRIIKLNARDLEEWRTSFWAIPDMVAELRTIDAKFADDPPKNGKWHGKVAAWLRKRHENLLAEAQGAAPKRGNGGFVPLGVGG